MKKVLITGADSYIGTSVQNWCTSDAENLSFETLDMINEGWRKYSFSDFDAVFHVAGIAHVSSNNKLRDLYFSVNCDLAYETAQKAKNEGVGQFIFMSSIKVYDDGEEVITESTIPKANSYYGESKLQAEKRLNGLLSDKFKIAIIRAPMIYGENSKGNYSKLVKLAKMLPIFPKYKNQRSMLHIDNLCEFIKLMILNEESGLFFPQNEEYVATCDMVSTIRKKYNKKTIMTGLFNWIIKPLKSRVPGIKKLFGNLVYDKKLSEYKENYRVRNFEDSITV